MHEAIQPPIHNVVSSGKAGVCNATPPLSPPSNPISIRTFSGTDLMEGLNWLGPALFPFRKMVKLLAVGACLVLCLPASAEHMDAAMQIYNNNNNKYTRNLTFHPFLINRARKLSLLGDQLSCETFLFLILSPRHPPPVCFFQLLALLLSSGFGKSCP